MRLSRGMFGARAMVAVRVHLAKMKLKQLAEGCIVPVDCVRVKSAQRGSLEKILLLGKITQPTDWTRARGTI